MDHAHAVSLIRNGIPEAISPTLWADLGCGNGTFTKALADLLADGSIITAIDRENHTIISPNPFVKIQFHLSDFTAQTSVPLNLDGILAANALHYVRDQLGFLTQLIPHMKKGSCFLIVEYDTDRANQWVPYPLPFNKLTGLLSEAGFSRFEKIGERDSVYRSDKIYSAVATV